MRRFFIVFLVVCFTAVAWGQNSNTSVRDAARAMIYAVRPADQVAGIEQSSLTSLYRWALGMDIFPEQERLASDDNWKLLFLCKYEALYRANMPDKNKLNLLYNDELESLKASWQKKELSDTVYTFASDLLFSFQLRLR
jgi:hypothetical protein